MGILELIQDYCRYLLNNFDVNGCKHKSDIVNALEYVEDNRIEIANFPKDITNEAKFLVLELIKISKLGFLIEMTLNNHKYYSNIPLTR